MKGAVSFLVFLILLLLICWGLNIYKHIRSGSWKGLQRCADIIVTLLLAALFAGTIIPLLR